MDSVKQQLDALHAQQQEQSYNTRSHDTQSSSAQMQLDCQPKPSPQQPGPPPPPSDLDLDHDRAVPEMRVDVDGGPATIPSSSVSAVSEPALDHVARRLRSADPVDVGILTEDQAAQLFGAYAHRLDHYLYRILGPSATLAQTRASSPLLLAAVCTVGALHSSSELGALFKPCYRHLRALAADLSLCKDASLDDIRGLCIGAFWLHDISWNLSSIGSS